MTSAGALKQNLNIQNQYSGKSKQNMNADQCVSSSKVSEKLDKKHVINLSAGNQKNIKVS